LPVHRNMAAPRVAIIGGGVSGSTCALELLRQLPHLAVTVFDQGRTLGGRAAHRRVALDGEYLTPQAPEAPAAFDHGCQFFRADTAQFRTEILPEWLERGWAAEWSGQMAALGPNASFFGAPSQPPFYVGVGGMSALPTGILAEAARLGALVRSGVRVSRTKQREDGIWRLFGTSGQAALHDTPEAVAKRTQADGIELGEFDAVVVTDASASRPSWHRASAGLPEEVGRIINSRARVALFTALVAFKTPLPIPHIGLAFADSPLWFASRSSSKPGVSADHDCWTLVCTPEYAAEEIQRVPMQDPETGAFIAQDPLYLREGPSAVMLSAFQSALKTHNLLDALPETVYVGGQRWGSAFPAPIGTPSLITIGEVEYTNQAQVPLAPEDAGVGKAAEDAVDFFAADEIRLYYAGDFVSKNTPGLEAAALSARSTARHLANVFKA